MCEKLDQFFLNSSATDSSMDFSGFQKEMAPEVL